MVNYKEKSAATAGERPENRIEYQALSEGSKLVFDSVHESPAPSTYYETTKQEEIMRETAMRKDLILQDLVPLLLAQNGEYPKTRKFLVAFSRFGATQVHPDCAKMKESEKLIPFARKYHNEPYQQLLDELIERASLDNVKLN